MSEDKVKTGPSVFLSEILGQQVKVKLNNGVTYLGNLNSIDGYMNIVMDSTSEHVNGEDFVKTYGDVFIRGNNVLYISQV
ncbi:U6 snRNA-associated Sm-like protein LSm6 [[Candida] jaroonii]|uniref:U6 snRNA-associated Sm-like protein LSm6 n=1 Tax=[Candida] jaroonii TaxID=467808 RepID=A0ACA9Y7B3_9ASCO|nr:U6 snRNA-associated Sm-like protein LSm6 [[Candida] jaroonii]